VIFSSPLFLFGFLPIFLLLYHAIPDRGRNVAILAASLGFYAWGEPTFVFIALASALLDLAIGNRIAPGHGRGWLALGIGANIGLLAYFKYADFALANLHILVRQLFGADLPGIAAIALPIGISFIVFEKITYLVDLYRGTGRPARQVLDYLTYVFLFPKLLAGPIVKYHDIAPQLEQRPRRLDDLVAGLLRFAIGLIKKVLLADPLGELVDLSFGPHGPDGFGLAWASAVAFGLQIFFDFSGYADMAIGLARMLGFRLMENFDRPYLAVGFGDFWRRWHISLSSWIRDYLYIPLGGDRVTPARLYLNLWICFLASGLWHGAAWTFIVWGIYHGLFLTLDRLFLGRWLRGLPRAPAIALTFLAVTVGWVVFRAASLGAAFDYLVVMASPWRGPSRPTLVSPDLRLVMATGLVLCFLPGSDRFDRIAGWIEQRPFARTGTQLLLVGLFLIALGKATASTFQPFLYFRF
jgi:alginate O-acetyltransferase complex protein AlgI